jgi:rhodanese-related sulfurtransferase
VATITVDELHRMREEQSPHSLIDVREKGEFVQEHIFRAVPIPRGLLEMRVPERIPDRTVPIIVYDDDGHRASLAAATLRDLGHQDVRLLDGGLAAWRAAGHRTDYGTNVPGKDYGEKVAVQRKTPHLTPDEIVERQQRGENLIILDSRTQPEYERSHVPGAYLVPGGELPARVQTLLAEPENKDATIVVNCAGRTRSILGADILLRLGIKNPVYALENGTMAWSMAGHELERGPGRTLERPGNPALEETVRQFADRVAAEDGVKSVSVDEFIGWRNDHVLHYGIDVRLPDEYAAGHIAGTWPIPAGQLALEADEVIAVNQAPVVMISNSGIRAKIGASLARQIGYPNVYVLEGGIDAWTGESYDLATEEPQPTVPGLEHAKSLVATIDPAELAELLGGREAPVVVDVRGPGDFTLGHIEGSVWVPRGDIERRIGQHVRPGERAIVAVCNDGVRSSFAAATLLDMGYSGVRYLSGGLDSWFSAGHSLVEGLDGADVSLRVAKDDVGMLDRRGPLARNRQDMIDYLEWEIELGNRYESDTVS